MPVLIDPAAVAAVVAEVIATKNARELASGSWLARHFGAGSLPTFNLAALIQIIQIIIQVIQAFLAKQPVPAPGPSPIGPLTLTTAEPDPDIVAAMARLNP